MEGDISASPPEQKGGPLLPAASIRKVNISPELASGPLHIPCAQTSPRLLLLFPIPDFRVTSQFPEALGSTVHSAPVLLFDCLDKGVASCVP